MKAHLMYPDRDFGLQQESLATQPYRKVEVRPKLLSNEDALIQDLELNTLFNAMAGGDKFLFAAARQAVLSGLRDDLETIRYRQAVLKDTLRNVSIVKTIYDVALAAIEHERRRWWGIFSKNYPSGTLHSAVELVQMFMGKLSQLKHLADEHSDKFESEGFRTFFAMLKAELADEYFARVKAHLKELKFGQGVLVSVQLGKGNQGTNYVLRHSPDKRPWWIERFFPRRRPAHTFRIDPRDEAGARALGITNSAERECRIVFPFPRRLVLAATLALDYAMSVWLSAWIKLSWATTWMPTERTSSSSPARTGVGNPLSCAAWAWRS
jgi:hypothetical protein